MALISDLKQTTGSLIVGGKLSTTGGVVQRVVALTDAATVTPNVDNTDIGILTSLSQTTTFANPTGTPIDGQLLLLRITSSTSRAISFGANYALSSTLAYPTVTTGGGVEDTIAFRYSVNAVKYMFIGTTIGATPTALRTALATVDFTTASTGRFFSVSVASAVSGDRIVATPSLVMPSGVTEDELECDPVIAYGSCTTSGTVRLFVGSVNGGLIIGQRNINLLLG